MASSSDYALIEELRAMRPNPRPAFAAELDERAAAGFPRRPRLWRVSGWVDRIRPVPPRRMLLPAGGVALTAVAVATAFAVGHESGAMTRSSGKPIQLDRSPDTSFSYAGPQVVLKPRSRGDGAAPSDGHAAASNETAYESEAAGGAGVATQPDHLATFGAGQRLVERSAELGLTASPGDVESDASRVASTVHRFGGVVMRSTTTEGRNAGANFSLSIPSAKVGAALDALSRIDRVRTRHEATADVTAPAIALAGRLKESEARVESLLAQLGGAETEAERQTVEAELVSAHGQVAAQHERLARLHRRVDFSRVEVRIESAKDDSGSGSWGIDDALHDAGHVLSAAAGVILIALAILVPLALIAILAWLARRAWLSSARRRSLG